ncbi:Transcriptional regulator, LysR family [Nosema bombycis CQ1]|uniref:Transcriptional regulator, LysR family n=1 Tax=Nosema bombycis (strain CQ1 / CVCC 102059) TaxID=578461 RepID=R0KYN5_NOSB1|nr:Transcriptional regulator, LysR family [Nosema bombycis CQ1]|eukprot:EOB15317.1 Transcriptional regulator, LysR family [Nosema bombycis CQ1]
MAITLRKNNSKKESTNSKKESNNSKKESNNSKKESNNSKKESNNSKKESNISKKESTNSKKENSNSKKEKSINAPSLTTPEIKENTKNTFKKDEIELASGSLTIDGVVRLLLLNMVGVEHFEKERSKIDNNNISKFYLRSLTSELVIYDELDLVLISYGCMISIKLEGDGELFSSALPDEYSHRVYIRIGKGQLSSDTVSPALKYKPGSFKKVEKYLSTRNIPKAVSFPNKIRELISDDVNTLVSQKR